MAHGDAREGEWKGNWLMEWVASTLHTTSEHGVSSITTADWHASAASSRLNWRPSADLNGLVRFTERRNLVSARVPSHFNRSLQPILNNSALLASNIHHPRQLLLFRCKYHRGAADGSGLLRAGIDDCPASTAAQKFEGPKRTYRRPFLLIRSHR